MTDTPAVAGGTDTPVAPSGSDAAGRDAFALAADIASGVTPAAEVLEDAIARIEALDPQLNAMVATRFDAVRASTSSAACSTAPGSPSPWVSAASSSVV